MTRVCHCSGTTCKTVNNFLLLQVAVNKVSLHCADYVYYLTEPLAVEEGSVLTTEVTQSEALVANLQLTCTYTSSPPNHMSKSPGRALVCTCGVRMHYISE